MIDDFIVHELVGFCDWLVKGRYAVLLIFFLDMLENKIAETSSVGVVGFQTLQCLAQKTLKEILIPLEPVAELPVSSE